MKSNSKAGGHQADAVHRAAHHDQRVGLAGVLQRFLQPLGVLAAVLELQRVDRQHFLADLVAAFGIEEGVEPRARADAVVVAAGRADVLVLLQVGLVQHRLAARALDPQAFGHAAALGRVGRLDLGGQQFFEPAHAWMLRWDGACDYASSAWRIPRRKSRHGGDHAVARLVLDQLDDLGADHHRVGHAADGLRGGGVADAEAHAHRDLHVLADARQHLLHRVGVQVAGAGHALERDVVDVAAGHPRDLLHALVGAGGRQQEDQVHAVRLAARRRTPRIPRAGSRRSARRRRRLRRRRGRRRPCRGRRS